jgi:hypothetical protein
MCPFRQRFDLQIAAQMLRNPARQLSVPLASKTARADWMSGRVFKAHCPSAMEPYLGIVQSGRSLNDYGYLVQSREAMFDHLVWWGEALKAGRQGTGAEGSVTA